jgi:hypothetical protein
MSEIRTRLLDVDTKIQLCKAAHDPSLDILELLPSSLTPDEVDSIGLQVSNLTESVHPSRDAFSHGRKNETDVVRALGFAAAVSGDVVTARSASVHLGCNKLSVSNWIARGSIWLQLKGQVKS